MNNTPDKNKRMTVMERAMQDVQSSPQPTGEITGVKTQTRGAMGAIRATLPSKFPIIGQKVLAANRIRVREGFERDAAEYTDQEFQELKESIRVAGINDQPIDIRMLDGVPGYEAELLAGTRRLRACLDLKLHVSCIVRDCSDEEADRIHETENKHRKNKAPYSRGTQYQTMLDSGRYQNASQMGEKIGTPKDEISLYLGLIKKAPEGMWAKVIDPGAVKTGDVRALLAAYDKPAFTEALGKSVEKITAKQLLIMAQQSLRPPMPVKVADTARIVKKGKAYTVVLPLSVTAAKAEKLLELVKKELGQGEKL